MQMVMMYTDGYLTWEENKNLKKQTIMNCLIIAGVIGAPQIILIVVIILLLFGGKKIPELMKGLGQGMKEFKKATKEGSDEEPQAETDKKITDGDKS